MLWLIDKPKDQRNLEKRSLMHLQFFLQSICSRNLQAKTEDVRKVVSYLKKYTVIQNVLDDFFLLNTLINTNTFIFTIFKEEMKKSYLLSKR